MYNYSRGAILISNNPKKQARTRKSLDSINPVNSEQEEYVESIQKDLLTIVDALYGTGKTFLALVESLKLVQKGKFDRVMYVRPYVPAIGTDQDIGSLPGTVDEKLFQFRFPVMDALESLFDKDDLQKLFEKGTIEATTPSFLRGRSIKKTIVILEEAQNCDKTLFEMVMSRIDIGSKLIIIGSSDQIDLKKRQVSYLSRLCELLYDVKNVGVIKLTKMVRGGGVMSNILKRIREDI